jgi:hypothetical protein
LVHDDLDLDGRVQRQHGDAHGRARVHARLAEHLVQQRARAVDDAGLASEGRVARHEPDDLDDPDHAVQVPDERGDGRDGVQRRRAGEALRRLRGHLAGAGADLAADRQLARHERQLAGRVDVVARPDGRDVGGDGRGDLGQRDAELREPRDDGAGHFSPVGRLR